MKELVCVLLGSGLVAATYLKVMGESFGRRWRVWFILLAIVGMALAFRLMTVRYLESLTTKAYGLPFAIAGGDLINGRWADRGAGLYMPLPMLANVACGVTVCMAPLTVLSHFRLRKNEENSRATDIPR